MTHHAGEVPRRWVSEATVLDELERLNDTSMSRVQEYSRDAVTAAEAEANHKSARARRILQAKAAPTASGRATSMAEAEVVAEADEQVADLYLARLIAAAKADACKEALRSIRNNQDALRTAAASHRDQVAGPGWSGR